MLLIKPRTATVYGNLELHKWQSKIQNELPVQT